MHEEEKGDDIAKKIPMESRSPVKYVWNKPFLRKQLGSFCFGFIGNLSHFHFVFYSQEIIIHRVYLLLPSNLLSQTPPTSNHIPAQADSKTKRFQLEIGFDQLLSPDNPDLWRDVNHNGVLVVTNESKISAYVENTMKEIIQMVF